MKITKKNLESLIKEELAGIIQEQDLGFEIGSASGLSAVKTAPRPTQAEFANEPVATYTMQRLDAMMATIVKRVDHLESLVIDTEEPSVAIANQVGQVQERLVHIVKEEISKMINEEDIEGLPVNKEFTTEQAIPILIKAIEKLTDRVNKLEKAT